MDGSREFGFPSGPEKWLKDSCMDYGVHTEKSVCRTNLLLIGCLCQVVVHQTGKSLLTASREGSWVFHLGFCRRLSARLPLVSDRLASLPFLLQQRLHVLAADWSEEIRTRMTLLHSSVIAG